MGRGIINFCTVLDKYECWKGKCVKSVLGELSTGVSMCTNTGRQSDLRVPFHQVPSFGGCGGPFSGSDWDYKNMRWHLPFRTQSTAENTSLQFCWYTKFCEMQMKQKVVRRALANYVSDSPPQLAGKAGTTKSCWYVFSVFVLLK